MSNNTEQVQPPEEKPTVQPEVAPPENEATPEFSEESQPETPAEPTPNVAPPERTDNPEWSNS